MPTSIVVYLKIEVSCYVVHFAYMIECVKLHLAIYTAISIVAGIHNCDSSKYISVLM